ncbi:MAG: hypothetical protein SOU51_00665 [Collinsella sp.]|nr:hypothetical protein [Collinsella sp.]
MTEGTILLNLQELDLALERDRTELASMPEIKALADKRAAYLKLKRDATKLTALRKDIEIEIADLDENERFCNAAVEQAQGEIADPANHNAVQDLEVQLSSIAKRLDKISFSRQEKEAALAEAADKERYLLDYIARFEASVVEDTRRAREHAEELKGAIEVSEARRAAILSSMDPALKNRYEKASKRFKGLFVERLEGNVPSICRTALQTSSLDLLADAGEVAECPYCHRILVMPERGGE